MISPNDYDQDAFEVTLTLLSCVRDLFKDIEELPYDVNLLKYNLHKLEDNDSLIELISMMGSDTQFMANTLINIIMNYATLYRTLCNATGQLVSDRVLNEQSVILMLRENPNYLDE